MSYNPYPESCDRLPPVLFGTLPEEASIEALEARLAAARGSLCVAFPVIERPTALALELDETQYAEVYTQARRNARRRIRAANRAGRALVDSADLQADGLEGSTA